MLEVEVVTNNGAVICIPKGDLDVTTVTTFRGALALCLGGPDLIIDLSSVRFIDGAGLTAVVGAVRRAQDERTQVAVVVPAGALRSVLDEAGLGQLVRLPETVDLACAEIGNDPMSAEPVDRPGQSERWLPSVRRGGR